MKVSIDTCVLLDLLLDQNEESVLNLRKCMDRRDELVICTMVFGELCPFFSGQEKALKQFLAEMDIRIEDCLEEDFAHAGGKWYEYLKRHCFVCPACGKAIQMTCPHCHQPIRFRQHILADFVIGAFSELRCDAILTRDYGYYRTYFPELRHL